MATLPPSARALLQRKAYGHIVTLGKDGSPQVTMVWVDGEGDELLINSHEGRQKVINLRRDPRVIVSVQDNENPQQYLLVHGRATVTNEGAEEHVHRIAKKYTGAERFASQTPPRVLLRIRPDRVSGSGPWTRGE